MLQVNIIQAGIHPIVFLVDRPVLSDDCLVESSGGESSLLPVVGDLGEVRDQSGDGLPHYHQELNVRIHGPDPARYVGSYQVAGTLLNSDLARFYSRHL